VFDLGRGWVCTDLACWNRRCDAKEFQEAVDAEQAERKKQKTGKAAKPSKTTDTQPLDESTLGVARHIPPRRTPSKRS
jgi:hypothetical protein